MKQQVTHYIRFIGSYLLAAVIYLLFMSWYTEAEGLYITFQPYVHLFFLIGFGLMLTSFIISRKTFKSATPYRIHFISLLVIFLPVLIYQLLFGDFRQVEISQTETDIQQKLFFYYFIFVAQAYIFGSLILFVSSIVFRNKPAILYSSLALVALSGFIYLTVY